jgi:hypothetical protein
MAGFWVVCQEVQSAPALLDVVLGVGAQAVHQVWKLDAIADEEDLHGGPFHHHFQSLVHMDILSKLYMSHGQHDMNPAGDSPA